VYAAEMQAPRHFAPAVLSFVLACAACSSAETPAPAPETTTSPTSPTAPAEQPAAEEASSRPTAPLTASPSCGETGERVVLRLDWTSDKRVPECMRPDDFEVRFGSKKASITNLGPTSDGFCALDVVVPAHAESGAAVKVTMGLDVFESPSAFAVPCQANGTRQ
jgi:hypothetical protein